MSDALQKSDAFQALQLAQATDDLIRAERSARAAAIVSALAALPAPFLITNNLSEGTPSAMRTSLGLGTVATLASDTDTTLAANSDSKVATQKATKAYADTGDAVSVSTAEAFCTASIAALGTATSLNTDTDGTLSANSDSRVATQKATRTYADNVYTNAITYTDGVGNLKLAKASNLSDVASIIAACDTLHTQSSNIASAATTDLSTATGWYVNVTGTVTITAFGTMAAGVVRILRFGGILTLTHNGTSLILPGGGNIGTTAGDRAIMLSLGSGNWACIGYQRALTPPPSGTNTGDQSFTASGDATAGASVSNLALTLAIQSSVFKAAYLSSPVTTASNVIGDVTGLSFAIAVNEVWAIEVDIMSQCSTVNGHKWAINGPTGMTVAASLQASRASSASIISDDIVSINTLSTAVGLGTYSTGGFVRIVGIVTADATHAGTVQVRFASATNGDTTTAKAGSTLKARRLA